MSLKLYSYELKCRCIFFLLKEINVLWILVRLIVLADKITRLFRRLKEDISFIIYEKQISYKIPIKYCLHLINSNVNTLFTNTIVELYYLHFVIQQCLPFQTFLTDAFINRYNRKNKRRVFFCCRIQNIASLFEG